MNLEGNKDKFVLDILSGHCATFIKCPELGLLVLKLLRVYGRRKRVHRGNELHRPTLFLKQINGSCKVISFIQSIK